jgi:predicted TIM-barrel fold metal-dependent hydrolase
MRHGASARGGLATLGGAVLLQGCLIQELGGASSHDPEEMRGALSPPARALIKKAFVDVGPASLHDHHVHVVGVGTKGSGAWVNPASLSWRHPIRRLKTAVYLSGAGITDLSRADEQYVARLVRLIRSIEGHGKFHILAFDHRYRLDGSLDLEKSEFHTPNAYVFRLAEQHPDLFVPVVSVHPYRPDALAELERWAERGARTVKWLPNAQGIDAADSRLDEYYRLMKRYDLVLLTHVGEEQAVEGKEDQALGNPLRFRRPLDLGVRVVMAHCGSLGENEDLDRPGRKLPSFDLFLRLMDDERYEGLLFGDISAMTQFNRLPDPLLTVLRRKDLHHRLVNGSDYPLPSLNVVIWTRALVRYGMITSEERKSLNEIYDYNPLLFDYVVKRTIRLPGTGERLPPGMFGALER